MPFILFVGLLHSVHLMYNWIFSDVKVEPRVGQDTSLIHIPLVAIMADSILGHQLDQLASVKTRMDVMVEEDIFKSRVQGTLVQSDIVFP